MRLSASAATARTFASFQHRNYRLYFFGQFVSQIGTWLQSGAAAWLVLELTHSAAAVGVMAFWQFGPYALFGLFGGALSDRFDRRKTLICTQFALMACSTTLAGLTLSHSVLLWQVDAVAALRGMVLVFDTPSRQAFVVQMVGRKELPNAVALNSSLFNASRIVGPALGGVLIGLFDVGPSFAIDAVSYISVIIALGQMRPNELYQVMSGAGAARVSLLRSIRDGLRYAWRTPAILLALTLLLVIATVCINFTVLMPVLAAQTLHSGPEIFGLISACFGAGALLGALISATISRASWPVLLTSAGVFGVAMIVLAPQRTLLHIILLLIATGIAFTLYTSNSNALVQLATPPQLQGRVVGLYGYIFNSTTVGGSLLIGWLSETGGTQLAFFVAGGTALLMALVGATVVRAAHISSPTVGLPAEPDPEPGVPAAQ
jgi:MFS family permease